MRIHSLLRAVAKRAGVAVVLLTMAIGDGRPNEQVIVINSFDQGDFLLEPTIAGIRERLSSHSGIDFSVEYLDAGHRPERTDEDAFEALLAAKYRGTITDVVVALGEPAFAFVKRTRTDLFGTPLVVYAEAPALDHSEDPSWMIGYPSRYGMRETLALMRRLHPGRDRILVVDDDTERARWLRLSLEQVQSEMQELTFRESAGWTLAAIEIEVASLGREDLVLYLSYTQDPNGAKHDYRDALARLSAASAVPVYSALDGTVGFGAVGGYVLETNALGRLVGDRIVELLQRSSAANPGRAMDMAPHSYVFDFRQLDRFGIAESELPKGSLVIEEPDTFYYRYRRYTFAAAGVLVAMLVYIGVLLSGIARRDRVRLGLERLLSAGEARLPVGRPAELVETISDRLRRIVPSLRDVQFEPSLAVANGPGLNSYRGRTAVLGFSSAEIPAGRVRCRAGRRLDAIDQRMLDLATRTMSIECENLQAARLSSSLEAARRIQRSLLPRDVGPDALRFGLDAHAVLRPAREVGGDLYDLFAPTEDRLCLVIGDVSDKGVPSALLMAVTRTLIRGLAEAEPDPAKLLAKVNVALAAENESMMFVTLFLAVADRRTGSFVVANAGHNAPLLRAVDGSVRALTVPTNIALAVHGAARFEADSLTLAEGESLLLYTDGVTEAESASGAQFGERRLADTVGAAGAKSAVLVDRVMADLRHFVGGAPQTDDITLMAVSRPPR